jgi:hypothetical protein
MNLEGVRGQKKGNGKGESKSYDTHVLAALQEHSLSNEFRE